MESSRGSLSPPPIHLHPTAAVAERILLPGDPARALLLAQALLKDPVMFNHHRGLWGYTGQAPDGKPLTIQSTGMGGPSAAIVVSELADLGARRLIRVGTCGALSSELALGDLLVVTEALPFDGTSRALLRGGGGAGHLLRKGGGAGHLLREDDRAGQVIQEDAGAGQVLQEDAGAGQVLREGGGAGQPLREGGGAGQPLREGGGASSDAGLVPDGNLLGALLGTGQNAGPVASTDLYYDTPSWELEEWAVAGALAVEMETATLFALARRRALEAAALLLVSDLVCPERVRISEDALRDGERRLGQAALSALID